MTTATKPRRASKKAEPKSETLPTVAAIKGMDRDMTCRGHKFEIGQTYTVPGKIKACSNGFHSCPTDDDTSPHAVFEYYAPGISRYFDVTAGGATDRDGNKIASASITIGDEITMGEIMRRVAERCAKKAKGAASNSGDYGAASNSGYSGAASNSGDYGAASNSGTRGAASNSGYSGAASNSGDSGAAFSTGYGGKVMSEKEGCSLHCDERDGNFNIVSAACGITGRDGIKASVWYVCRDGKLVPAS